MTHDDDPPAVPATTMPRPSLASWNRSLNETHAMAAWRARSGRVVRGIEARRRRLVAEAVRRLAPRRVIDVGCEDGWLAEAYAEAVEDLVLVDLDPATLTGCPLAARPGVRTAVADATSEAELDAVLERGEADVVVLSALLEHLPQPRRALAALRPFLAPGGRFVVYVPADRPILAAKQILGRTGTGGLIRGLSLEPAPGHLHVFSRRALRALLGAVGSIERLTFDPLVLGYLAVVRIDGGPGSR